MPTVHSQITRLMRMPLRTAVKKVASKALQEARFAYRQYKISRQPIALTPDLFHSFEPACRFLVDSTRRGSYRETLIAEGLGQDILRDAERICAHVFNLLGSGDIHLGEKLPWNKDFKTGYVWEHGYYKRITIVDLDRMADVKVPWELSRFQHAFTLGKAYWLTDDEKYAQEFQAQIEDWIDKNPVEMTVNWTCAMDVAIRATNWIGVVPFFRESPSIPSDFWNRFDAALYLHARFIRGNLENEGEHTGNHYIANLSGLAALGIYFGDFAVEGTHRQGTPREWLKFAMAELEDEITVQVNPDGTHYEASTSYHRLVAEMLLVTGVWCARNGHPFSKRYQNLLESMHEFMLSIMKPDGLTPLIGDADDGRYVIAARYGRWARDDFRHLLAVAGEFFNRDDFRAAGRESREDALWIAGGYREIPDRLPNSTASTAFPDGGYYVLRNPHAYCLIRCGELSFHGQGAHSHNDQLSFVLNVNGRDIAVDPGSYVYSADYQARNLFRGTGMHSTLQVGDLEQNEIEERILFRLQEQTFASCEAFTNSFFAGSHRGYAEKAGVIHKRELSLDEACLTIRDTLVPANGRLPLPGEASVSILLAPGATVAGRTDRWIVKAGGCRLNISFEGTGGVELRKGWASAAYGTKAPALILRASMRQGHIITNICWE